MTEHPKEVLFKQLKDDLDNDPPILDNMNKLLVQFVEGLCRFCPSKTELHEKIRSSFPSESKGIDPEYTILIIRKLVFWIETFQSYNDDIKTQRMLRELNENYGNDAIIKFLKEYYDHTEKVYKNLWEARQRLVNGENVVPPEYRPKGDNGVPKNMRTGR
tara:strand:+ start:2807 stop:3286 length:480 start_codon:yes stop_codon:yes gene_type:complete